MYISEIFNLIVHLVLLFMTDSRIHCNIVLSWLSSWPMQVCKNSTKLIYVQTKVKMYHCVPIELLCNNWTSFWRINCWTLSYCMISSIWIRIKPFLLDYNIYLQMSGFYFFHVIKLYFYLKNTLPARKFPAKVIQT